MTNLYLVTLISELVNKVISHFIYCLVFVAMETIITINGQLLHQYSTMAISRNSRLLAEIWYVVFLEFIAGKILNIGLIIIGTTHLIE